MISREIWVAKNSVIFSLYKTQLPVNSLLSKTAAIAILSYVFTLWKLREFSLTHFSKNFVNVTVLLNKLLKSWFDEIFFGEREFLVFPQCGLVTKAQCGNDLIFLSLRFYVKSILKNQEVLKLPFCHLLGCEICEFDQFQPSQSAKIPKNHNSESLNLLKWQSLHFQNP